MSDTVIAEVARTLFEAHGAANAQRVAQRAAANMLKEDRADLAAWWEGVLRVIQELIETRQPGEPA
jgi:hypothetical protein